MSFQNLEFQMFFDLKLQQMYLISGSTPKIDVDMGTYLCKL